MKHFNITFKPDGGQISIHAGATLVEAVARAGIVLNTSCGQKGTCGKCLVTIEPGGEQVNACQYCVRSDLVVTVPDASRLFRPKILEHGVDTDSTYQPDIYKQYFKSSDTGVLGVAVDIGTSTIVAKLIDMTDGKCLATSAALNPQTRFGDDVISRINYAQTDEKLTELHNAVIDCLNQLIEQLCKETANAPEDIFEICAVGNTTMNHIFLKLPVEQLGRAPYEAFSLDAHDCDPNRLALNINLAGNVHAVENIAGFVGADTTAVALAVDIESAHCTTLAIDIGTNGELMLAAGDKLYAASCAAGPAFEGARIICGGRAVEGAIEAVVLNEDDIDLDVIGNCPPRSICGSGLVDAVAVMLELNILDATGCFTEREKIGESLPPKIAARLIQHKGQPAFLLAKKTRLQQQGVFLTQRDIRQIQLAKAAIRAGIKLLQKKNGLRDCDIEQVVVAGAFGNYIRPQSALRIGLMPDVPLERIQFVGNAACSGAQMLLLSNKARDSARKLARKIEYVEIANEKDFTDVFADALLFPDMPNRDAATDSSAE